MSKILQALKKLDPTNDAHWTSDGMPRLDTVRMLAADQSIGREDIAKVAPGFSRDSADLADTADTAEPVVIADAQATAQALTQAGEAGAATVEQPSESDTADADAELEQGGDTANPTLQERHDELVETLAEMDSALARFNVERAKVVSELDEVILALEAETPKSSTSAIQGYLAAQNATAQRKAAQVQELKELGVNPQALLRAMTGRAPVDAARQRKGNIDGV